MVRLSANKEDWMEVSGEGWVRGSGVAGSRLGGEAARLSTTTNHVCLHWLEASPPLTDRQLLPGLIWLELVSLRCQLHGFFTPTCDWAYLFPKGIVSYKYKPLYST
jgi:hypothetical protein